MTTVSLVEDIAAKVAALPVEWQRLVLYFVEFIMQRAANNGAAGPASENKDKSGGLMALEPLRGFEGIWANSGVEITAEEIAETRTEMWGNFPREHFYTEKK